MGLVLLSNCYLIFYSFLFFSQKLYDEHLLRLQQNF